MKTRATRKFEVTVGTKSTVVCAETKLEAIERAVEKMYGKNCFWFASHGAPGYGQVFEALKPSKNNSNPGNTSRTYQVGIDVDPVGNPSPAFLAQRREDKKQAEQENILFGKCRDAYALGLSAGQDADPKPAATKNHAVVRSFSAGVNNISTRGSRQAGIPRIDSEIDRGYADGLEARADAIEDAQRATENEKNHEEREQQEYMNQQMNEARAEMESVMESRHEHNERISAEVFRLQNFDFTYAYNDDRYNSVVNGIAATTWTRRNILAIYRRRSGQYGISLGDWKREMRAGKHPGIVAHYIKNTDWLSERLKNVVR